MAHPLGCMSSKGGRNALGTGWDACRAAEDSTCRVENTRRVKRLGESVGDTWQGMSASTLPLGTLACTWVVRVKRLLPHVGHVS